MMHRFFRKILLACICITFSGQIYALEMKEGRIKLQLHEDTGRFSLYYLHDVSSDTYEALFVDQDPRTSSLSVLLENKVLRLGDNSSFRQEIFQTSRGAGFLWTSGLITVKEEFSFISSQSSMLSDGVAIKISITNNAESAKSTGVRYLFDTHLGERRKTHFSSDRHEDIRQEVSLPGTAVNYLLSRDETGGKSDGFQIMTGGLGTTTPESIVLANWKRLNNASWTIDVQEGRDFSLLPYSINDSALALYYQPQMLGPGKTREVVLRMGNYSSEGFFDTEEQDEAVSSIFRKAVETVPIETDMETALQNELLLVENLIQQVDRKLASGESIRSEEVQIYVKVLEELRKRINFYE